MQPQMRKKDPPKFAIANGFVIGSLPEVLHWTSTNGDRMKRKINDHDLTDLLKAMLVPVRPYGCVFSYSGETQKYIKGNFHFFEMDQNRIGGDMNKFNKSRFGDNICCVLCGRMTPDQKKNVRERSKVNTQLLIDIMTWLVQKIWPSRLQGHSHS
jgi:hypothetical protein